MTNQSIKNAFERLWHHVLAKLSDYVTAEQVDSMVNNLSTADIDCGNW